MSREYLNDNSKNRPHLNSCNVKTIKFKTLYISYDDFKNKLKPYGFIEELMSESNFMILQSMLSNSYLKYKTDVKNYGYIVFEMKKLMAIKQREQKLYDLDLDSLLNSLSENEQKFYTINKTEQGSITDVFLDNSVKSTLQNKESVINKLNEISAFNKMELPELTYLSRLANSVVYPLQPNQLNGRLQGGQNEY